MDNNLKGNPGARNYGGGFKPRGLKPFNMSMLNTTSATGSSSAKKGKRKPRKWPKNKSQNVGAVGTTARPRGR